jgi:DNA-binding MarR family transcriptional regulator
MDTNAGIILDFIKRNPGCMSKDVVDATGIEMKDVSNELTRLEKKRLLLVERRSFDTGAVRRVFTVAPGV